MTDQRGRAAFHPKSLVTDEREQTAEYVDGSELCEPLADPPAPDTKATACRSICEPPPFDYIHNLVVCWDALAPAGRSAICVVRRSARTCGDRSPHVPEAFASETSRSATCLTDHLQDVRSAFPSGRSICGGHSVSPPPARPC